MTDGVAVVEAGVQTCLTGNVVDTSTAEAMVAEAICMLDAALEDARSWGNRAETAATFLRLAEDRTDRARQALQAAERLLATEQAARLMAEHMLAAEAALADAQARDVRCRHVTDWTQ